MADDLYMKQIPGLPDHFVSLDAKIYFKESDGTLRGIKCRKIRGYSCFSASRKIQTHRRTIVKKVHRCMLMAFKPVENCASLLARHLDDNKDNNSLGNLEWGSHKDNYTDQVKNRRASFVIIKSGQDHINAKLTANDVYDIRSLFFLGAKVKEVSMAFGVTVGNLNCIKRNKTWRKL